MNAEQQQPAAEQTIEQLFLEKAVNGVVVTAQVSVG
jgi:hypothetical protein